MLPDKEAMFARVSLVGYTHNRVDLKCVSEVLGRVVFGNKCPTKHTLGCLFSLATVIFFFSCHLNDDANPHRNPHGKH